MKFFHLTSNERRGLLGAFIIMFVIVVLKFFNNGIDQSYVLRAQLEVNNKRDSLKLKSPVTIKYDYPKDDFREEDKLILNPVMLNPNFTNSNEWEQIGIPKTISERICKYIKLKKGIQKPSELLAVYGFRKEWLKQIEDSLVFITTKIDIQVATEDDLISVKGIGGTYAKRIVKYREILGGYFSINQLGEVYGIDSLLLVSISDQIICSSNNLNFININEVGYNNLYKHPYISKKEAMQVIIVRTQKGEINLVDLQDIFSKIKLEKVEKYLKW